jgi:hypothetical protein
MHSEDIVMEEKQGGFLPLAREVGNSRGIKIELGIPRLGNHFGWFFDMTDHLNPVRNTWTFRLAYFNGSAPSQSEEFTALHEPWPIDENTATEFKKAVGDAISSIKMKANIP